MMNLKNAYYHFFKNTNRNLEQQEDQEKIDTQRRKMLSVNPNARFVTVFGATFSM